MKRNFFICGLILCTFFSLNAQWTGTNPIWTNSNVGIGTTSPTERLAVRGNISKETSVGIDNTFDNFIKYGHYSDLESGSATANRWHGIDATITAGAAADNKMKFRLYHGSYDNSAPIDVMTLTGAGNVGIGTTDPGDAVLKVYKSSLPILELQSSVSRLQIGMATCDWCFAPGAKSGDAVLRTLGEGTNNIILNIANDNNDGNSYIAFGDNANDLWMKINNNKTVRIDGIVYATELNVTTDVWSDNVFKSDYKLPSLEEVESFIKENQHLPDVPSENDVKSDGINVAQMDAVLLKKIEELTLYLIELKKENKDLKQQIENFTK
jgi:hypothetical protein